MEANEAARIFTWMTFGLNSLHAESVARKSKQLVIKVKQLMLQDTAFCSVAVSLDIYKVKSDISCLNPNQDVAFQAGTLAQRQHSPTLVSNLDLKVRNGIRVRHI